jgi:SAM-dependent methyltransferase
MMGARETKSRVREFWNRRACGEVYARGADVRDRLDAQRAARFRLEPFILDFAAFEEGRDQDVLEVGVGLGADHWEWARSGPRSLSGVDLTRRAIGFTRSRLELEGLRSGLMVADAENLPFGDGSFDIAYSWGVLHHTPDTRRAIDEVWRVLRRGGTAKIMLYHRFSLTGLMLWARYALLGGKPLTGLTSVFAEQLESPGTQAFSLSEVRGLFGRWSQVSLRTELAPGDLLTGEAGQRHQGIALELARRIWPRRLIRQYLKRFGLFVLISARK